jgi:anti-sigma factor RsiW
MITTEQALRLQAWLDGEVSDTDARAVESWLKEDAEARALLEELRVTLGLLVVGVVARAVPETREFYWSQFERGLGNRETVEGVHAGERSPGLTWWRRWLLPAGAIAGLVATLAVWQWSPAWSRDSALLAVGHEIDTPLENVSSFMFTSESARMTVVWVNFEGE